MTSLQYSSSVNQPNAKQYTLAWALLLSLTLHILIATLPKIHLAAPKLPETLTVEITQLQQQKVTVAQPAPEAPKPIVEPRKETVQQPVKPVVKMDAPPTPEPVSNPQPSVEPTPPAVMTAEPKPDAQPAFTAPPPPPEPAKPSGPSQEDLDAARKQYAGVLNQAIAKQRQYSKMAQERGWEGDVELEIQFDNNGKFTGYSIVKKSEFDGLDQQAKKMVEKAALSFPAMPAVLHDHPFKVQITINFHLE